MPGRGPASHLLPRASIHIRPELQNQHWPILRQLSSGWAQLPWMDLYCMDGLTLVKATAQDADVVFRLMQLYYFEASAWSGEEILADGLYDCALADVRARLQEEPEWTRLLWLDGQLCGFVQVDEVEFQGRRLPELADLFILPKHRGKGIASAVVAELVRPTAGEWLLATFRKDHVAHAFWERNLARMGMACGIPTGSEGTDFRLFLIRAI